MTENPADSVTEAQKESDPAVEFRKRMESVISEIEGPIIIIPHQNPDLDCLTSAIALKKILEERFSGKTFEIIIPGDREKLKDNTIADYSDREKIEWSADPIQKIQDNGMVILVDNFEWKRAGISKEDAHTLGEKNIPHMIIDHHPGNVEEFSDIYIEPTVSSNAEVIARIYSGITLKPEVARLLALGMVYDTGGFAHVSTDPLQVERMKEIFNYLLGISGSNIDELKKEAEFSVGQETKAITDEIEKTFFHMPISDDPEDYLGVFFEPERLKVPQSVDISKVVNQYVNDALHQEKFGLEGKYAVYIKPIVVDAEKLRLLKEAGYPGGMGDIIWEIKLRTDNNSIKFADKVGHKGHRGGRPGAAVFEYWPQSNAKDEKSRNEALAEFIRVFRETREENQV